MDPKYKEQFNAALDKIEALLQEVAEFYAGQSLGDIQTEYRDTLYAAMKDYLESEGSVTRYRNEVRRAANNAFTLAFVAGWAEGGASGELPSDEQSWLDGRIEQEISFIDGMFSQLKDLRDDTEMTMDDKLQRAQGYADGYTQSLAGVYSQGQLMAAPHIDLTFVGQDGSGDSVCQKNGGTCVQLKGKTHPASWWIEQDLLPYRGNQNYDCGCWNCLHRLEDKDGKVWASADIEGLL